MFLRFFRCLKVRVIVVVPKVIGVSAILTNSFDMRIELFPEIQLFLSFQTIFFAPDHAKCIKDVVAEIRVFFKNFCLAQYLEVSSELQLLFG